MRYASTEFYIILAEDTDSQKISIILCFDVKSKKFIFIIDQALSDLRFPLTLINYNGKLGVMYPKSFSFLDGRATSIEFMYYRQ